MDKISYCQNCKGLTRTDTSHSVFKTAHRIIDGASYPVSHCQSLLVGQEAEKYVK